jgi:hypothetical protein
LALAVCAVSALPQGRVAVDEVAVEPEAKSTTTPVPIIKQINKVNDDGSYTFGYEAGDGSFRIEKKELNGYVKGIFDPIKQLQQLPHLLAVLFLHFHEYQNKFVFPHFLIY